MTDRFESPFSGRYASEEMQKIFSQDNRYGTWRKLWVSLAKAERALGLPITEGQVAELAAHVSDIDYETVRKREAEVRHDVMAHVYAFGVVAPSAAGIIHLGATSCYVTDNADIIIYKSALELVRRELVSAMSALADFCERYKDLPCLGYTHFQPAQPVTVGKRFSLYLQDFEADLADLDFMLSQIEFLGCRGTTGTEASFMDLFEGDEAKIDKMNELIAADFGFKSCVPVCGQTYPRKMDARILKVLSGIGQSAYRLANDIRLLQHDHQIEEPYESKQIGSSAMAYKRNPMRCERICSLSRYLINAEGNAVDTAALQWMERTLDDSAGRRIYMPESFLCADSVLRLVINVVSGLQVNEKIVEKTVADYMPFIATENVMMEAVKRGGDRQQIHEIIRECSVAANEKIKQGGTCELLDLLAARSELGLDKEELLKVLDPKLYVGRSGRQVENYLKKIKPMLSGESMEAPEIKL